MVVQGLGFRVNRAAWVSVLVSASVKMIAGRSLARLESITKGFEAFLQDGSLLLQPCTALQAKLRSRPESLERRSREPKLFSPAENSRTLREGRSPCIPKTMSGQLCAQARNAPREAKAEGDVYALTVSRMAFVRVVKSSE